MYNSKNKVSITRNPNTEFKSETKYMQHIFDGAPFYPVIDFDGKQICKIDNYFHNLYNREMNLELLILFICELAGIEFRDIKNFDYDKRNAELSKELHIDLSKLSFNDEAGDEVVIFLFLLLKKYSPKQFNIVDFGNGFIEINDTANLKHLFIESFITSNEIYQDEAKIHITEDLTLFGSEFTSVIYRGEDSEYADYQDVFGEITIYMYGD